MVLSLPIILHHDLYPAVVFSSFSWISFSVSDKKNQWRRQQKKRISNLNYRHDRYRVGDTWYTTVSSTIGPKSYISVRSLFQGRGKIICSSRIEVINNKKRKKWISDRRSIIHKKNISSEKILEKRKEKDSFNKEEGFSLLLLIIFIITIINPLFTFFLIVESSSKI